MSCKVVGKITKGDRLVSDGTPGHARTIRTDMTNPYYAVIGRALETKDTEEAGVIEIVVGAK